MDVREMRNEQTWQKELSRHLNPEIWKHIM